MNSFELFAGAGGITEGFRLAGINTYAANEIDEMAGKTLKTNHPSVNLILDDLASLKDNEIFDSLGTKIDIVAGGPPCQGFSLAGRRLSDDPRNALFKEFGRVVAAVSPDFFVFENVSGIVSMQKGEVLKVILDYFKSLGYALSSAVLNAADYGAPQARPRFIILGAKGRYSIEMPEPTHGIGNNDDLFSGALKPHITCWDALSDLPVIHQGEGAEEMQFTQQPKTEYQESVRGSRRPNTLFNHKATAHSEEIIRRYTAIPEGGDMSTIPKELRTKKNNVHKLARDKPARTVTCNHRTDLLHPVIPRGTTVREAARLQGFPDDYQFFGNLTRKARFLTQDDQVGNAVPVPLAKAIGLHIMENR